MGFFVVKIEKNCFAGKFSPIILVTQRFNKYKLMGFKISYFAVICVSHFCLSVT